MHEEALKVDLWALHTCFNPTKTPLPMHFVIWSQTFEYAAFLSIKFICFSFFFFFLRISFIYFREKEIVAEVMREYKQGEKRAKQGAWQRAWPQDREIMTWAKGRQTTEPPRCPNTPMFLSPKRVYYKIAFIYLIYFLKVWQNMHVKLLKPRVSFRAY